MEPELCKYCEKDLKDPDNIVIGTFRFRGPRMYHLDCYEKMKLDSTWKKLPRTVWTRDKLPEALRIAFGRLIGFVVFSLLFIIALFYGITRSDPYEPELVLAPMAYLIVFLPFTIVLSIKSLKYYKVRNYIQSLEMKDMSEERKAVEGRL